MNIDLNNIKATSFGSIALILSSTVLPGSMFLYVFAPNIFFELDVIRLILLSFAATMPFLFFNSFLFMLNAEDGSKNKWSGNQIEKKMGIAMFFGGMSIIPVFYFPILLGFFINLAMVWGVVGILFFEIISIILINKIVD